MINQKAVERFLVRELNNFDWLKEEPKVRIDQALAELVPPLPSADLWLHQKVCLLILEALKRFMLHIDMGGGKTKITLTLLKYRKDRGEKPRAIVFVPFITAVSTWIEETGKHGHGLTCTPLVGTTGHNLHLLQNVDSDLFVICYQSAVAMLSETKKNTKGKKKWMIDSGRVRAVFKGFDTLVMDEVHKAKSVTSLTYKMLRAISAQSEYCIGLTGTPFGKDLTDLWPQFNLIDFGDTLGPTLGFYRQVFFQEKVNFWGGYDYTFKKELFPDLQRIIKNSSIRYAVEDFHDMPEKQYIPRYIKPPEGIKAYADKHLEEIRQKAGLGGKSAYQEIESSYLKLRQLASGFMTLKGEDNDKLQVSFDENPKLDILQELIEELPEASKMIVFHHFVYTNTIISDRLKEMKIGHARVYGKQRDPLKELARFKEDPKCKVLVINSKSGSSSLNLQIANYQVYFEQPDSPIDRQQAERRSWRPGQTRRVFIYDLLMQGTADIGIYKSNIAGKNMLTELLDGKSLED